MTFEWTQSVKGLVELQMSPIFDDERILVLLII